MKKKFFQVPIAAVTALLILSSLVSVGFSQRADLDWQITVNGNVQKTLRITLADIIAMPRTTIAAELTCYGEPLKNGQWTGVKLSFLLGEAGLTDQNLAVTFKASDGYEIKDFPMIEAMREDVILAYELDGQPLLETIRLVVPEANGNVWIRQITQITVQAPSSSSGNPVQQQLPPVPPYSQPLTIPSSQPAPVQTSSPALNVSVPQKPANQSTVQQPDPLSSASPVEKQEVAELTAPIDYSYALVAVVLVAAGVAAAGIIIVKRRKTKQQ